jgi:hypothetical protein
LHLRSAGSRQYGDRAAGFVDTDVNQRFGDAIVSSGTLKLSHKSFADDFRPVEEQDIVVSPHLQMSADSLFGCDVVHICPREPKTTLVRTSASEMQSSPLAP